MSVLVIIVKETKNLDFLTYFYLNWKNFGLSIKLLVEQICLHPEQACVRSMKSWEIQCFFFCSAKKLVFTKDSLGNHLGN